MTIHFLRGIPLPEAALGPYYHPIGAHRPYTGAYRYDG
jgi:hypothetical protein